MTAYVLIEATLTSKQLQHIFVNEIAQYEK